MLELPRIPRLRVEQIAARIWPDRSAAIEPLGGGITNHNSRFMLGAGVVMPRAGGKETVPRQEESMKQMTDAERREFLLATPARTGKLAVTRKDGRPYVVPIWFDLDGDEVVFTTGAETVKGRSIRRDGRVCLCVDDERPPFAYVTIEGEARVTDDLDEMLLWATRIGGRYMGADVAEQFGRRNAVPGELLIRVAPARIIAGTGVAD